MRELCEEVGRDPATLPIWGRHYLDGSESWRRATEQAVEIGFSHFSVGFDRFSDPAMSHRGHLDSVIDVVDEIRAIVD